jgi:hypothetical protein
MQMYETCSSRSWNVLEKEKVKKKKKKIVEEKGIEE